MDENRNKTCALCTKGEGRYQCPRCNILFCSTECYKHPVHSQCSEEFYEDCVRNELCSLEPNTQESQKKLLEILKRLHETGDELYDDEEQLDSDDDDDVDLAERLKGVDLNEADKIWEKLTDSEKQEFENLLKSSDITDIVPEFQPWWDYNDDRKVIALDEPSRFEEVHKSKCPEVEKIIIPFCKITKVSPAVNVCYNLANVLAAYTFIARYYNGEFSDCAIEFTINVITLSKNLLDSENFLDFEAAIKSVVLEITNSDFIESSCDVNETIKSDVKKVFEGPDRDVENTKYFIMAALSDMYRLFSKAVKFYNAQPLATTTRMSSGEFSKRFPDSGVYTLPQVPKSKIKGCIKKIEYYMSWTMEYFNISFCLLH